MTDTLELPEKGESRSFWGKKRLNTPNNNQKSHKSIFEQVEKEEDDRSADNQKHPLHSHISSPVTDFEGPIPVKPLKKTIGKFFMLGGRKQTIEPP